MTNLDMTDVEDRVERALYVLAELLRTGRRGGTITARVASRFGRPADVAAGYGPEVWVTLAAASVAVVGVGALWAVGHGPC